MKCSPIPATNMFSNNVIASSILTLDLDQYESRFLLSSPQSYLSSLSYNDATRIRSVLIPAYKRGFRIIFLIGAALASFSFFLAFWLMPHITLKRDDDDKLKEEGKKRIKGEHDEEKRG
jgi:hypothetical protein